MKHLSAKHLLLLAAILTGCLTSLAQSAASYATQQKEKSKTFLIINTYSEMSPWTKSIVTPITYYIANDDSVHAELYHLNSVLITDSVKYQKVFEEFISRFGDRKIDYVAFIGQMAFSFRDEVKKRWGKDIPMLLISRDITISDVDYYFSGYNHTNVPKSQKSLAELKNDYNFTAVYTPDFYRETVDLMIQMLKGMNKLVVFSDAAYYNRHIAQNIKTYLAENHPDIKYELVKASMDDNLLLQYYLTHTNLKTGLLMSSWNFEKPGPFGYPILVSGDLNLLYSSANPIFSLRHGYMDLGSIGGVYTDPDDLKNSITDAVKRIVHGEEPRDIPFYSNKDFTETIINYTMLKDYELSENVCPPDTIFIGKPLSFWKKYLWQMIAVIAGLAIVIFVMIRRNMAQKHEIEILTRHKKFIDIMPVPYSKARIKYSPQMDVTGIEYTIYNQAFDDLIKENRQKGTNYILFPNKFIAQKTTEMLDTGEPVSFMYHFPEHDKYLLFTLCVVESRKKDAVDVVDSIDIFAIDITERQKNQRELREISQRLDLTINISNIIPWEWDMKTDIMYFKTTDLFKRYEVTKDINPEKEHWSALPTADFMRMLVNEDKEEMRHVREQLILDKINKFHVEYRIRVHRNGKDVIEWFDVNGIISERDDDGHPSKVIGTLMIVTDQERMENELIEAKDRATESDRLKSTFLANMSHEIRTPLNAILGFSSLMCEEEDPEKRREYAGHISKNNEILLTLVNDVLDLAKIESNTIEIVKSPTDLNSLMHTLDQSLKSKLQKGVTLTLVNGMKDCMVNIDSNRVAQVLMNMLSNAAKFTAQGNITFGYDMLGNNHLHFYVRDTGKGISPANRERLFTRFDRLDIKNIEGTGLGLSICKLLVEQMGGKIGVESKGEGQGSTFWFTLPYEAVTEIDIDDETSPADTDEIMEAPQPAEVVDEEDKIGFQVVKRRPMILVAEDIEGNFLLLKNFIGKDFDVKHAWDGEEAVEMYSTLHPDMILMDIGMPKLDGYHATEIVRRSDTDIPIIAVTAYAYATDRKRIMASGFDDFVTKPISREALFNAINRHLHKS